MALDGVIFDLDGTLLDSNGANLQAWKRAFDAFGYRVADDRIFSQIGKGGDNFVPSLLGKEADEKDGEALRAAQPREFEKIALRDGLRVFPGSRELLLEVRRRGLKSALATSGGKKQLDVNERASGLPVSELVDVVVNADDIEQSKPAPDLVSAAARKLRLSPAQCVMIGDTPFDAQSSRHAGVVCLGLTCGGHPADELRRSGARAVWRDPADLLAHLDQAIGIASPATAHLTQDFLERLMQAALQTAERGMEAGEAPIGAALARGDGSIIAHGYNSLNATGNPTAHAEIVAFAAAAQKIPPDARDLILVSNLEPCVMCLGAAMEAAVDTLVYALSAPADGGAARVEPPTSPESAMPRIVGGILADRSRALFERWLKAGKASNPKQARFVEQLLALTR